jgi:hypothetical protein
MQEMICVSTQRAAINKHVRPKNGCYLNLPLTVVVRPGQALIIQTDLQLLGTTVCCFSMLLCVIRWNHDIDCRSHHTVSQVYHL